MRVSFVNTSILAVLLISMVPVAVAQAVPPSLEAATKTKTEPLSPMESRQKQDASVDRNILVPSAETIGKGKYAFNSYELAFAGFTYGMTDSSQLSVSTLLPIVSEFPTIMLANVKIKVAESDRMILSVQPQGGFMHKAGGGDSATIGILGGGIIADVRLDDEARAILSGAFFSNALFASSSLVDKEVSSNAGMATFTLTASFNYRVGKNIKLMTELTLPAAYVWAGGRDEFEVLEQALLLGYGIRFFGEDLGVDLSFLRPIHPDVANEFTDYFPMGYPYLAFSGRF
jgi:hypothetical protein